ncbi:12902_t:CDS:2 [Dentiscutata erythropus]|uniref:12902_t:CDS:1 n=1 Tax=Dentiscutata erythropus TaxID=1348616 RepID=A0A9N9IS42_9GLOM|nr:12902_t:CDS:2 [Dentiscutata erythropus]
MFIKNPENQNIIDGKAVTSLSISGKPVTKNTIYAQMALFSGLGLTEKDYENKINTIEAKLEDLCPYYSRIDIIYSKKQNVQPTYLENFKNNDNSNNTQVQKNNLSNYNSSNNINKEKELENNNNSNNIQDQRNNLFNFNNNDNIDNESELENNEFTLDDDNDDLFISNHK